jgi:hypothetical protein
MKKNSLLLAYFLLHIVPTDAREFRTPITLAKHPTHNAWCTNEDNSSTWVVWTGGFFRKAGKALVNDCDSSVPLSEIIFGATEFTAQDAFPNQTATDPLNPFLQTTISPRLKYIDRGFIIGLDVTKNYSDEWRFGARFQLPYRKFTMENYSSRPGNSGPLGSQDAQDLLIFVDETVGGSTVKSFAFRLDILDGLHADCKQPGLSVPFVNYANISFPNNPVTMANQDINPPNNFVPASERTPVTLLNSANGTLPSPPYALTVAAAQALPCLSNSGIPLEDGERERFCPAPSNYTSFGANTALHSQVWVVPTVDTTQGIVVREAGIIRDNVQQLLTCIQTSPEELFEECGLNVCSQTRSGLGDLDTELYAQWCFTEHTYLEFLFGLRFPIAGSIHNSDIIFNEPLGNNGHTEVRIGGHLHVDVSAITLSADGAYSWVLKNQERVPAAFAGATIKNLGPEAHADIWWNYYVTHLEVRLHPPINEYHKVEYVFGYEFYKKDRDHIEFCENQLTDCLGNFSDLCAPVLEHNTNVKSNKIYIELDYRYTQPGGIGFGVFGGFSRVISGNNVPREQEWYFGIHLRA